VKNWFNKVDLGNKKLVGVFVNAPVHEIAEVIKEIPLSIIQCHGTETPAQVGAIKERTKLPVWKAVHHTNSSLGTMKQYAGLADGYIVDTKIKGAWGGTGISFDWEYVPYYMEEAEKQGVTCLIAGGVRPDNIEKLLRYHPHGIDISSGIEECEGKSTRKIEMIERKVKMYETCS